MLHIKNHIYLIHILQLNILHIFVEMIISIMIVRMGVLCTPHQYFSCDPVFSHINQSTPTMFSSRMALGVYLQTARKHQHAQL